MLTSDRVIAGGASNEVVMLRRYSTSGELDLSFNQLPEISGVIRGIAESRLGSVYLFGRFTKPVLSSVIRIRDDGSLDPGFSPPNVSGLVNALCELSSGRILLGGDFQKINSVARNQLALLESDGSLVEGFDPQLSFTAARGAPDPPEVRTFLPIEDDGCYIGGRFSYYQGISAPGLIKLRPDGTRDSSFSPSLITRSNEDANRVNTIARTRSGGLMVAGTFLTDNNRAAHLLRLHPDGVVDARFESPIADMQIISPISAIFDEQGRTIIALGSEGTSARLLPDGRPEPNFLPTPVRRLLGIVGDRIVTIAPDGAVVTLFAERQGNDEMPPTVLPDTIPTALDRHVYDVEGFSLTAGARVLGWPSPVLQWLVNDIPLPGATNCWYRKWEHPRTHFGSLALVASNRVGVVTSYVATLAGKLKDRSAGTMNRSVNFEHIPITDIHAMKAAPTGGVYLAGVRLPHPNRGYCDVVKLKATNELDATFQFESALPLTKIHDLEVLASGGLVISGEFPNGAATTNQQVVLWLDPSGKIQKAVYLGGGPAYRVYQQRDETVWMVGDFLSVGEVSRKRLAVFDAAGNLSSLFDAMPPPNAAVRCLCIDGEGSIWIGGDFTSVGAFVRRKIARLDSSGNVWPEIAFGNGFDNSVVDLIAPTPETVWAGGNFRRLNGTNLTGVARFALDGRLLAMQSYGAVTRFVPDGTGRTWMLAGKAVRLQADGSFATNGLLRTAASGDYYRTMAIEKTGLIYGGGPVSTGGEFWHQSLALVVPDDQLATEPPRLISSPVANQGSSSMLSLGVDGHQLLISWYRDGQLFFQNEGIAHVTYYQPPPSASFIAVASNPFGSVTSAPVRIINQRGDKVTLQALPREQVAFEGDPLVLSGSNPRIPPTNSAHYQWFHDSKPAWAFNDMLLVPKLSGADSGCYAFVGAASGDWSTSHTRVRVLKTEPWNEALDTVELRYVNKDGSSWSVSSLQESDGSMVEAVISRPQTTGTHSFGLYLTVDGTLRFRWRSALSSSSNAFVIRLQNGKTTVLSKSSEWTVTEVPISLQRFASTPSIEWIHSVQQIDPTAPDEVAIDWIEFVPADSLRPRIQRAPIGLTVEEGQEGGLAAMIDSSVGAHYQWFRNGTAVLNADRPFLFFVASEAMSGSYTLTATNFYGSVTTSPVQVRVVTDVPRLEVSTGSESNLVLTILAKPSHRWILEATADFRAWEPVGELELGKLVQNVSYPATHFPGSFFRVRKRD